MNQALRSLRDYVQDILPVGENTDRYKRMAYRVFLRACHHSKAYQKILAEHGLSPSTFEGVSDFFAKAPILDKKTVFGRFSPAELSRHSLDPVDVEGVITSSGQGGSFSYAVISRELSRRNRAIANQVLNWKYNTQKQRTLIINCLSMGVSFQSTQVSIANVSVREDMAFELLRVFKNSYDQFVIVTDPLFVNRLLHYAEETSFDWRSQRISFILGEESFAESQRSLVARKLNGGQEPSLEDALSVQATYGLAELGMHLLFETPYSIALRRQAFKDDYLYTLLYGDKAKAPLYPQIMSYMPQLNFLEFLPDERDDGFSKLVITPLNMFNSILLPRYHTGDRARLLGPKERQEIERRYKGILPQQGKEFPIVALLGRSKEQVGESGHILELKEILYSQSQIATKLTGAFYVQHGDSGKQSFHVQCRSGMSLSVAEQALYSDRLKAAAYRFEALHFHPYQSYPFAMTLDFERKLNYQGAGRAT